MENEIISVLFDFYPLSSNFRAWKTVDVHKGDYLMFLKDHNLPWIQTSMAIAKSRVVKYGYERLRYGEQNRLTFHTIWYDSSLEINISKELKHDGYVKGKMFICLQSLETIWLSGYDYELLKSFRLSDKIR